jgi:hypothetical protein
LGEDTSAHITNSFTFCVIQSKYCFATPYFAKNSKQVRNNSIRKIHITIYIPNHQCGTQTQSKYLKLLCEQHFEVQSIKIITTFVIINQQLINYHGYYEILTAKHHPS